MAFPKSARRAAWETFVSVIKNDPILRREVTTLKYWSGDPKDAEGFASGMLPYLRLTPKPEESMFLDTRSQQADILVDVEAAMTGTNISDGLDFWEAIERALYPADPTAFAAVDARLKGVGIQAVEFLMGAWGVVNDGGQVIQAKGQIRLSYFMALRPL
jgi:hypothetical protein